MKKLILSPDGGLWLVPWAALPLDRDRFLIEDFAVRQVNSGRNLVATEEQKTADQPPILLADPQFEATGNEVEEAVRSLELDIPKSQFGEYGLRLNAVGPLPGTRQEAAGIRPGIARIAGVMPEIYLGAQAAEGVIKSAFQPQMLVVSTHGFVLTDESADSNPLNRCGLLLAGCNHPQECLEATGHDGILTGAEIVRCHLRGTELVVLSACETGLGTIQQGEGIAGLQQSFQLAGARSVLATLWQIPDLETARLISALFNELASGSTHDVALRTAMLERIDSRRQRHGAAHPIFWAAFMLTGAR